MHQRSVFRTIYTKEMDALKTKMNQVCKAEDEKAIVAALAQTIRFIKDTKTMDGITIDAEQADFEEFLFATWGQACRKLRDFGDNYRTSIINSAKDLQKTNRRLPQPFNEVIGFFAGRDLHQLARENSLVALANLTEVALANRKKRKRGRIVLACLVLLLNSDEYVAKIQQAGLPEAELNKIRKIANDSYTALTELKKMNYNIKANQDLFNLQNWSAALIDQVRKEEKESSPLRNPIYFALKCLIKDGSSAKQLLSDFNHGLNDAVFGLIGDEEWVQTRNEEARHGVKVDAEKATHKEAKNMLGLSPAHSRNALALEKKNEKKGESSATDERKAYLYAIAILDLKLQNRAPRNERGTNFLKQFAMEGDEYVRVPRLKSFAEWFLKFIDNPVSNPGNKPIVNLLVDSVLSSNDELAIAFVLDVQDDKSSEISAVIQELLSDNVMMPEISKAYLSNAPAMPIAAPAYAYIPAAQPVERVMPAAAAAPLYYHQEDASIYQYNPHPVAAPVVSVAPVAVPVEPLIELDSKEEELKEDAHERWVEIQDQVTEIMAQPDSRSIVVKKNEVGEDPKKYMDAFKLCKKSMDNEISKEGASNTYFLQKIAATALMQLRQLLMIYARNHKKELYQAALNLLSDKIPKSFVSFCKTNIPEWITEKAKAIDLIKHQASEAFKRAEKMPQANLASTAAIVSRADIPVSVLSNESKDEIIDREGITDDASKAPAAPAVEHPGAGPSDEALMAELDDLEVEVEAQQPEARVAMVV